MHGGVFCGNDCPRVMRPGCLGTQPTQRLDNKALSFRCRSADVYANCVGLGGCAVRGMMVVKEYRSIGSIWGSVVWFLVGDLIKAAQLMRPRTPLRSAMRPRLTPRPWAFSSAWIRGLP